MSTAALIYSVRFSPKLVLPVGITTSIEKLRLTPATYRPIRPLKPKSQRREEALNWREHVLFEYVRKIRETVDPKYDEIFQIFNKIGAPNMDILSKEALAILKTSDEQFRLRVTTLLFDRAIKGSAFASVMADLAKKLNDAIPEVSGDLEVHVKMFTKIYDMSETLTFPKLDEEGFEDNVVNWAKQKDMRRGYARFLTHLYVRDLIPGKALQESMQKVIQDLTDTVVEPKTAQSEENTTQFADFLFEIAKILKPTAVELRGLILVKLTEILARPRPDLPSLNMRSRFKLEDTVKCVKVC